MVSVVEDIWRKHHIFMEKHSEFLPLSDHAILECKMAPISRMLFTMCCFLFQVLGEVKFEHPVQAIDTTMGGRLFAVGDGARSLKMCSLK